MLAVAAATVTAALASSEELTIGQPTRDGAALEGIGQAVLTQFTGPVTGELAIVVDDDMTAALHDSKLGPLDVAQALTPTLAAVADAIGPVVLGPPQVLDTRLALHRVLAFEDSGVIPLIGANAPIGAVAIGIEPRPVGGIDGPAPVAEAIPDHRLDLLRGVEMDATVELGRARMTVNELLALRNGAVIELDRAAGAAADLYVNGRLIARGEVVVIDENYGLRITQVVTDDTGR